MYAWRLCCLAVACFSICVGQQNTATILGTVTDPSGSAITKAKVTALDELTGLTRSVETDAAGSYLLPLLPVAGRYQLTAEAPGFKSSTQRDIQLQLNQNARFDLRLEVGNVSERVEVTASTPLVDTYTSA